MGRAVSAPLAASTLALSLLSEQHCAASYSGHPLSSLQARLAQLEQNMLVKLTLPQMGSAYVVFQAGSVVYAQSRDQVGLPALDSLSDLSRQSTMQVFVLSPAASALALAAADGKPLATGHMTSWSHQERLSQLLAGRFSGVLVSGVSGGVNLWQLVQGRVQATQEFAGARLKLGHLLFGWTPRLLPHLMAAQPLAPERVAASQRGAALSSVTAMKPTRPAQAMPDDAIWALFHATALHHLGSTAERLLTLMRGKYGQQHGAQLFEALGQQLDHLSGKAAGQQFRARCARPQNASTPLSETSSAIWSSDE